MTTRRTFTKSVASILVACANPYRTSAAVDSRGPSAPESAPPIQTRPLNAYRFSKGDEYVWERIDDDTGITRDEHWVVVFADESNATFSNGIRFDQAGNLKSMWYGYELEPVNAIVPVEFVVGRKWRSDYRIVRQGYGYTEYEVAGRDLISTRAGSFDTFRIEGETRVSNSPSYNGSASRQQWGSKDTYWLDPKSTQIVRWKVAHYRFGGGRSTWSLVSAPWVHNEK